MGDTPVFLHLTIGLLIRLAATLYSVYHDATNLVKYTDIDYSVFTDGASYVRINFFSFWMGYIV